MEQLFFAGKAYLKINSLVKMPLHEFMAVERSGLWAPEVIQYTSKDLNSFSWTYLCKVVKISIQWRLSA